MTILIIGSSGYFAEILIKSLLKKKYKIIGVDLNKPIVFNKYYIHYQFCGTEYLKLKKLIRINKIKKIIHLATLLDFAVDSQNYLYKNNLNLAKNITKISNELNIEQVIFTSSNSIYAGNKDEYINESTTPIPIDSYGKSKLQSEFIFHKPKNKFNCITLRVPNIVDEKRIGMVSILFDLILNDNILWVVNNGKIKHQCLYAKDLVVVIHKCLKQNKSNILNIGSHNVPTFKYMFKKLILSVNSKSKILSINKFLVIFTLWILKLFNLSPFGGYQIRMLTKNLVFNTKRAENFLNWKPKINNTMAFLKAFKYYKKIKIEGKLYKNSSYNSQPVKMKLLKILTYLK